MKPISSCLRLPLLLLLLASLLTLGACGTRVTRVDVDEVHDLSGRWNDTDSRLVSEEMIGDVLSRSWLSDYRRQHNGMPTVIVGEVRNLSHEHINVNTFISDMERELINSGKVQFVASRDERGEIREERADQELNAREDTRKEMGQEIGADFMLKGSINTIIDHEGKEAIKYYQVDLTLIDMADNRKVWVGQKKIKKLVEKGTFRL
jgi:uncharacterized protein (TIGR02722 family)